MLIVVSDLHFVDGTAGEHNLPVGAFRDVLLEDVKVLAKDKKAKEIKFLLLGDIVDLIRTEQWLQKGSKSFALDDRPWGTNGLRDAANSQTQPRNTPTERRCLDILGRFPKDGKKPGKAQKTILYKNWDTFQLLRRLPQTLRSALNDPKLPVEIIYVPGNHDRMVNLYPAVRDQLRKMMGLTVNANTIWGDPKGKWWYRSDFKDPNYWVYARHGHQYDPWNYGGGNDHSLEGQLQTSMGDVITTEFAVKIPWQLAQIRKTNKAVPLSLVTKLKDMDNVRPLSHIMEWFYYRVKREDRKGVRKALDKAFDTVVKDLLKIPFVQQWRSPATHIDEALRAASSRWLRWIPSALLDALDTEDVLPYMLKAAGGSTDPDKDPYAQAAYHERIWKEKSDIRYILYGHTHAPLQMPLDGDDGRAVMYVNTGTWRERIFRTIGLDAAPDFVETKQMTYAVFYRPDEDTGGKREGTVSFDMWTGSRKKLYK